MIKNIAIGTGIKIYPFQSSKSIIEYIENKKKILVAVNADKIINNNIELKKIINENIGYPDGFGAVLALKRHGAVSKKIPGCELWLEIIEAYKHSKTFYFIGSTDKVLNKTIKKLRIEFPEIKIVGYRNGYLSNEDVKDLKNHLKKCRPDVVFVAMGSPKQELLMRDLINIWPALYMGLGGSFDIYSDEKKRAPDFFIKYNLEWLKRRMDEPFKFHRQWLLVKFLFNLILKKI